MCPRKFQNLYLLGKAEKQNSSNLHFGTAVHMALKAQFDGENPFDNFNMYWDSIKELNLEYDRYSWIDLKSMAVDKFIPNFVRLHYKHFGTVLTEETVQAPLIPGHDIQGTFDLCGEHDGSITMTDWKTAGSRYNISKIYRNPQMYIYSYLYRHKYGILPSSIMYKVFVKSEKTIQTIKIPLTQTHLDAMMENVKAIAKDITSRTNWYCNPNCFCVWGKECWKSE